jgi:hypothetical protein
LLTTNVRRSGAYQLEPIARGLIAAAGVDGGVRWLADLSRSAVEPVQYLTIALEAQYIPESQRGPLYERIVESARTRAAQTFGEARENAAQELTRWQIDYARYLVNRDAARSRQLLAALTKETRERMASEVIPLEVRLAAKDKTLTTVLSALEPIHIIHLRNAANDLQSLDQDAAAARRVLEFYYTYEIGQGRLDAANFLGLAEARLEEKDVAGSLPVLRRMTLIAGEPLSGFDAAAKLLEQTGHPSEAMEFLEAAVKSTPWNTGARARLARLQKSSSALTAIANDPAASYETRLAAQNTLGSLSGEPARTPDLTALLSTIATDPSDRAARLAIFSAANSARRSRLAIAAILPFIPRHFTENAEYNPWIADQFLAGTGYTLRERVAIVRGLAQAHERITESQRALFYYQIAQKMQPAPETRKSIDALRLQIARRAREVERAPVITINLEQDRLVRPKAGIQ